jgi:hypothetical protein
MADEFEFELDTDDDPILAAITPKKTNKWGVLALVGQLAADVTFSFGDFLTALSMVAVRRYQYEDQRSTFAEEAGRDIDNLQGFYWAVATDEETEDE